MVFLQLRSPVLSIRLTRGEKIGGLLGDVEVPLSAVCDVEVVADAVSATRGLRAPGLALRLDGQRWDELLVGADDAPAIAAALTAAR